MNEKEINCPYCGSKATASNNETFTYKFVECPTCGRYEYQSCPNTFGAEIKDKIASYLYYTGKAEKHSDYRFYNFIGDKSVFDKKHETQSWSNYVSVDEIEAFYPKTFSERIDRILLAIANMSSFIADVVELTNAQAYSAFFVKRHDEQGECLGERDVTSQYRTILDYLTDNNYLSVGKDDNNSLRFMLKPKGWQRVDELQKDIKNQSKTVFIAMSFDDSMINVREKIKTAIAQCGYEPVLIDEQQYNGQIVPEMLYQIRQAKFVVADLTMHNNGAYYEAGYALGNGKEVIQLCKKECFGQDGHFDVKQINTILWENEDEIEKKLIDRIKATIE